MDSQSYDFGDLKICPAKFVFGILLEFRVQRYDLAGICEYEHRGRKQNDLMIFLQETLVCYIGFKEKKNCVCHIDKVEEYEVVNSGLHNILNKT